MFDNIYVVNCQLLQKTIDINKCIQSQSIIP